MNILYIHQYFLTPEEPGGTRSYWLARELVQRGHSVTMLTASTKFKEDIYTTEIEGINVIYIREEYHQKMSVIERLNAFLKFMYKASKVALGLNDIDLVFATSTPLTIGIPALLMKWFRRVPYVFEVRDLWPEVPIQMGVIKYPLTIYIARWLEKLIYINAEHVIALSPGMQLGVTRYIDKKRTSMIPNMSKKDEFWPRGKNTGLQRELRLAPDTFKIVHFGALGLANGVESIIESALLLKEDTSIEFLFLGGGSVENVLKKQCVDNGLNNVKFLGKFSMAKTSEIVNIADVSIISFKNLPILYTNSPNKLFDSLSAGKPIIVNSAGWTKDLVNQHNCGYYVDPKNPNDLVEKIKYLQNNPSRVVEMGRNARSLAENVYDKSILSKQFVDVLENV